MLVFCSIFISKFQNLQIQQIGFWWNQENQTEPILSVFTKNDRFSLVGESRPYDSGGGVEWERDEERREKRNKIKECWDPPIWSERGKR
jgi:hypothetical protein